MIIASERTIRTRKGADEENRGATGNAGPNENDDVHEGKGRRDDGDANAQRGHDGRPGRNGRGIWHAGMLNYPKIIYLSFFKKNFLTVGIILMRLFSWHSQNHTDT